MPFPIIRPRVLAAVAAVVAALPATASAHVTIQPDSAPAGGFTRLDVRVPNERDDAGTTQVRLQLPPGFAFVSYEPRPGWEVSLKKVKLDPPVKSESGFEIDEAVGEITWTGDGEQGRIAPGEFVDFGLSVQIPDGNAGDKLTFKALQTYDSGETVRWIGPEDADEPAPTVTLTKGDEPAAAAAAPEDGGDDLAIAGLVVGTLGLLAGMAALVTSRRTRVHA